jgi:hypothetical protein
MSWVLKIRFLSHWFLDMYDPIKNPQCADGWRAGDLEIDQESLSKLIVAIIFYPRSSSNAPDYLSVQ